MLTKIDLQLFADGDDDQNNQQSEKTFTQSELEKIIGERLAREREKYSDYEDLKEIEKTLEDFNYSGTPAEKKAAIKAYAEEIKKQTELEDLQKQANQTGTTPELLSEIKQLKEDLSEIKKEKQAKTQEEQEKRKQEEAFNKQVKDFTEKYPDINVDKLAENAKFMKFIKGRNVTLLENYEDFLEFIGESEKETIAKIQSNMSRSTASGRGKGSVDGGSFGLTDRQQELAKRAGMSNKEYAERLKDIV